MLGDEGIVTATNEQGDTFADTELAIERVTENTVYDGGDELSFHGYKN